GLRPGLIIYHPLPGLVWRSCKQFCISVNVWNSIPRHSGLYETCQISKSWHSVPRKCTLSAAALQWLNAECSFNTPAPSDLLFGTKRQCRLPWIVLSQILVAEAMRSRSLSARHDGNTPRCGLPGRVPDVRGLERRPLALVLRHRCE